MIIRRIAAPSTIARSRMITGRLAPSAVEYRVAIVILVPLLRLGLSRIPTFSLEPRGSTQVPSPPPGPRFSSRAGWPPVAGLDLVRRRSGAGGRLPIQFGQLPNR